MNTEEIKELLQKAFITPEKEGTDRSKWVGSCLRRTFCLSGDIKDITEAENAIEIYNLLEKLDPYSIDDLLYAHSIMTRNLIEDSGRFRNRGAGVVNQTGDIIHL